MPYGSLRGCMFRERFREKHEESMQRNHIKDHRPERVFSTRSWTPLPVQDPYSIMHPLPLCKDRHCIGSGVGVGITHHFDQRFEKLEVG